MFTYGIATYARVRRMEQMLWCCVNQTSPHPIVILNDCPDQDLKYVGDSPLVIIHNHAPYSRLGAKRNALSALVTTDWCAQVDDDDLMFPWHAEEMANALCGCPDTSCTLHLGEEYETSGWPLIDGWRRQDLGMCRGAVHVLRARKIGGYAEDFDRGEDAALFEGARSRGMLHEHPGTRPGYIWRSWASDTHHVNLSAQDDTDWHHVIADYRRNASDRMREGREPRGVVEIRETPPPNVFHNFPDPLIRAEVAKLWPMLK